MKRIIFLILLLTLLLTGCGIPTTDSDGGSASAARAVLTEGASIPAGEYADGAGDSLTLTLRENGGYRVDFGIYKLLWIEDAEGAQEDSVLHFEGTDDDGSPFAADITAEGDGLLLTVAESGHPDCPAGTEFQFAPAE